MDVTIVVLTHNRHRYLERLLEYYLKATCRVIILDSTKEVYLNAEKLSHPIEYYHCGSMDYFSKINFGLEKVKTTFTVFSPDDDFMVLSGIAYCVDFLKKNPDYSSAQGEYVSFKFTKDSMIDLVTTYKFSRDMDYNGSDAFQRSRQLMSKYMPLYYAVHKTENLIPNFRTISTSGIDNYYLRELLSSILVIMHGKHRLLPILFSVREMMDFRAYEMTSELEIYKQNKKSKELASFIAILTDRLSQYNNESIEVARQMIDQVIEIRCQVIEGNKERQFSLPKRFINKVLRKIENHLFNRGKKVRANYFGNPSSNTGYEVHYEWIEIAKIINKYKIVEMPPKAEDIARG